MSSAHPKVLVINGPNLNLLGTRQPEVYGTTTLADLELQISTWASKLGVDVSFLQSNHEGEIIDALHRAAVMDGVVLNPGAFAHTSRAIADAIASIDAPVIEVHISNIKEREAWRAVSVLEDVVERSIFGRGLVGYRDALRLLVNMGARAELISYGPHSENVGDLRVPGSASSAIMLVHGGFWLQEWGRDTMDSLAVDLHARGHATFNIEYRRRRLGGAWPGSAEDVWLAHDFLTRHSPVSDLPVTVVGHSAGGYLALHLSTRNPVTGVIALAPITDLEALAIEEGPGQHSAKEMLAAGAPTRVDRPGARVFHGDLDELVPPEHSMRLVDAEVHLLPGLGHFDLLNPGHETWASIAAGIA